LGTRRKLLNAYVAGILDGEGAVSLRQQNGYFQCRVSVSNTDKHLLDLLRADFGGLEVRPMSNRNPNARTSYQWIINGRDALPILQDTLPFLIVKKRHAEIAIEYLTKCSRVRTPEALKRSAELAAEMKDLNMKGPRSADSNEEV
jgi:hypothetical protein